MMCGRKAGDFIDITITSCPPEVNLAYSLAVGLPHFPNGNFLLRFTLATLAPALRWPTSATRRSSAPTSLMRPTVNIWRFEIVFSKKLLIQLQHPACLRTKGPFTSSP